MGQTRHLRAWSIDRGRAIQLTVLDVVFQASATKSASPFDALRRLRKNLDVNLTELTADRPIWIIGRKTRSGHVRLVRLGKPEMSEVFHRAGRAINEWGRAIGSFNVPIVDARKPTEENP